MCGVFGMQEAGKEHHISQSHVPGMRRIGFRRPSRRGCCVDLRFTSFRSESSKAMKMPRGIAEFKTESLPE
jgi:hypothetical protein